VRNEAKPPIGLVIPWPRSSEADLAIGLRPRFTLIVHYIGDVREQDFGQGSQVGRLDRALDAATAKCWTVVDLNIEWKVSHPFKM